MTQVRQGGHIAGALNVIDSEVKRLKLGIKNNFTYSQKKVSWKL
jgi:hypothetical protein